MERRSAEGRWWWTLVLAPISLLANPWAGLPTASYYFRDFTLAFFPLRVFAAREMGQGRLPVWNPLIHDGTFQLPSFYPPDLLHVFSASPVFVSWILTLHLPLAAFGMYWLVRQLGGGRLAGVAGGVVFSLGGLTLSALNLYVFLQALALSPYVVGSLMRVAAGGRRMVATAGLTVAVALSTMAIEFVAQAVMLGIALCLVWSCSWKTTAKLGAALLLACGLAAVPVCLTMGLLTETVRGEGFGEFVGLANALHPAVLSQCLLPNVLGALAAPAELWWGGRFFSKGFPYFLSLYLGPLTLSLAFVGLGRVGRTARGVLLGLGFLGFWYALGESWGLATVLRHVPGLSSLRYPVKGLLLPYLGVAILAGMGIDALGRDARAWKRLGVGIGVAFGIALSIAGGFVWSRAVATWIGAGSELRALARDTVLRDGLVAFGILVGVCLLWVLVVRGSLRLQLACTILIAMLAADLGRAGTGMNPQVPGSFFARLPELVAADNEARSGYRAFSYGLDYSPTFARLLTRRGKGVALAGFYLHRQLLGPYCGILDEVETSESTDLTSFVPRVRELAREDYEPRSVGRLIPWLRNAAVHVVFSLDELSTPDLEPIVRSEVGSPELAIHAYRVKDALPKASVACGAVRVRSAEEGLAAPYAPSFDPRRDVAVEGDVVVGCSQGKVAVESGAPNLERYRVAVDGPGALVVRSSWASGWTAWVDGRRAPLYRANGKYRVVGLDGGLHAVELRYEPPGLALGLWFVCIATGILVLLVVSGGRR